MKIDYENLRKSNQAFFPEFQEVFASFLESGWYVLGKNVQEFEEKFAQYVNTPFCTGVASGLDALELGLMALDLPEGSEVLVPSNTYIATILAIINNGLKPVLVEPNLQTYNMCPSLAAEAINPKTKAIMLVHLYGKPCQMDAFTELAKKHSLAIIEDCAQAHGAKFKGQAIGSFGEIGAFSFYPTKNLGALGDAGAITLKEEELYKKCNALRNYGSHQKYYNKYLGKNSRLDEVQAAFLLKKLQKINELTEYKRKLADIYFNEIKSDKFEMPLIEDGVEDVFHIFAIRHPKRDRLQSYLSDKGIGTGIHYPIAPNKQEAMKGILDQTETPIAEEIHQTILSLPISYANTEEEIQYIANALNEF